MPFSYQTFCFDDGPIRGRCVDVFAPAKPTQNLSFFFVHGGGWHAGSRADYHQIMYHLTARGYVCASVDYRLAGVTAIDQLADIRQGYHLFCDYLSKHNQPIRTLVHGTSAGAHLASLFTLARPGACGESLPSGEVAPAPVGLAIQATPFTFEPWDEIFPQIWVSMQNIAGEPYTPGSARYKALSPIEHLTPSSPAVLLMEAANEHMFPIELSNAFMHKCEDLGVDVKQIIYPAAEHGFFYDITRKVQKKALADLLSFAQQLG